MTTTPEPTPDAPGEHAVLILGYIAEDEATWKREWRRGVADAGLAASGEPRLERRQMLLPDGDPLTPDDPREVLWAIGPVESP